MDVLLMQHHVETTRSPKSNRGVRAGERSTYAKCVLLPDQQRRRTSTMTGRSCIPAFHQTACVTRR